MAGAARRLPRRLIGPHRATPCTSCSPRLALPFALAADAWKALRNPEQRGRVAQRLGFVPANPRPGCLWVHAVSVGEVQAAASLLTRAARPSSRPPDHAHHRDPDGRRARPRALRRQRPPLLPAVRHAGGDAAVSRPRAASAGGHSRDRDLAGALPRARPAQRAARHWQRAALDPIGRSLSTRGCADPGNARTATS